MRILRRYLFRNIVSMVLLVLGVLLALGLFIEFVDEIGDIGTSDYGPVDALVFAALQLPHYAYDMLPMAALLGALLGLGNLAAHSELIAIRAGGVSSMTLARAIAGTGLVLGLVALVIGGWIAPPLDGYARQFRAEAKYGNASGVAGKAVWIRDGDTYLQVTRTNGGTDFGGLYLFRVRPGEGLDAIGHADSAQVARSDAWILDNYEETQFTDERVTTRQAQQATEPNSLPADMVGLTVVREESLNAPDLYRYVRYRELSGLNAHEYAVAFWQRLATGAATAVMCVLALPFSFGPLRSAGAGARVALGVLIGLGYFLLNSGVADSALIYDINPALTAWLPTLALMVCAGIALGRIR
ncbi:MAG: LPS export ABC transporter permease LptG [Chromatiales bacterium]|nr:MAG: LPS export ABC transporter permease LptG [Chromatiales bacterium]